MIGTGELKRGIIIEVDGDLYQVIELQHVKMKRTALAKVKLRNVKTGSNTERSFQNTEKFKCSAKPRQTPRKTPRRER
jgi:elongation factor P